MPREGGALNKMSVEQPDQPPLEDRFSFLIHRINAHLARLCNPMFRRWRVDIDMARTLAVLDQQGTMAAGDIVRFMALPQSTVSHQLKRLEKLGYLTRSPDPNDSRMIVAALTPEGRTVARESNALSRRVTSMMVTAIADLDGAALRTALKRMDAVLAELRSVDAPD
jgi:DNA-binding MarR family transcriptional regulator